MEEGSENWMGTYRANPTVEPVIEGTVMVGLENVDELGLVTWIVMGRMFLK